MHLEARALAIGYRGHLVAGDIALSLRPGEILCLLGPNGAGKTTLFRTLLGLQPALGGAVLIDGMPLAELRPAEIARRLAYVPQAHVTEFAFSVLDVVLMGRTARIKAFASPGPADERIAREKLAGLGIAELASHDYTRISGGQRQLVLIARALAQEAPILVMDEPTASLDPAATKAIEDVIRAVVARNIKVVMSTHDLGQAKRLAGEVVLLHRGRLIETGPAAEFFEQPRSEEAKKFIAGELLV